MIYTVRLYKQHDLDLIYLYKNPDFRFLDAMKTAAAAYAENGSRANIKNPPAHKLKLEEQTKWQIHLSIEDDAINAMLKQVQRGFRCSFLKNILRYAMESPNLNSFFVNEMMFVPSEKIYLSREKKQTLKKESSLGTGRVIPSEKTKSFENVYQNTESSLEDNIPETEPEESGFDLFSSIDKIRS